MPLIRLGNAPLGGGSLTLPTVISSSVIPLRLGLSQLGHSMRKWRGTVILGRYILGGGGITPPDTRNAYIFWGSGTTVAIVPEVNGFYEHFTSQLGITDYPRPIPKLGYSFTLGYGGVIKSTYGQTGDLEGDGSLDFNFSPISLVGLGSGGWFLWQSGAVLTGSGSTPTSSQRFSIRIRGTEYADGLNWMAPVGLYYAPYNGRHLNAMLVDTFWKNRLDQTANLQQWTWHVPVVAQYARTYILNTVTSLTPMSYFSGTLFGGTPISPSNLTGNGTTVSRSSAYNSNYEAYLCFDSSLTSYWIGLNPTSDWISVNIGFSGPLSYYKFRVNTIPEPNRAPKNWTVSGSNDNSTWTTIDTQTNQTSWSSGEERTFTLSSPSAAYQYFKFSFTANNGDTYIELANIALYSDSTFHPGLTMSVFAYNVWPAIYLISGSVQVSDIQFDGTSTCAIAGEQYSESGIAVTTSTAVAISGVQSYAAPLDSIPGATGVAFSGQRVGVVDYIHADGVTDLEITDTAVFDYGFECDGSIDVQFTGELIQQSPITADGITDLEFTAEQIVGRSIAMDGSTACGITANQIYTSTNYFNLDGSTNVSITGRQSYASEIAIDGTTQVGFVNSQLVANAHLTSDGTTGWTSDAVADYFIHIDMDGKTSFPITAYYNPAVTIVCNGVGDMFYDAQKGIFQGFQADGQTDLSIATVSDVQGYLEWYTGINTNVLISPQKIVTVTLNMDGSTDVRLNVAQNVFGTVLIDQIQQDLQALGSFVRTDGAINAIITSAMTTNSKYIPLGSDYIWGIIEDVRETGTDPMPNDTFIVSSKRSRGPIPGILGRMNKKYAFGFSRNARAFYRKPLSDNTRAEWVRFNFFVESAKDFVQIDNTLAFTTDGITAIAGSGIFGREKEEYVTFAIMTNVRNTQETLEVLATGDPHVDVTQICYEMLWLPQSAGMVTQVIEEVLYLANLGAVQQVATETLSSGNGGYGLIDQVAVEMIQSIFARTQMTQITQEELQGPGDPYANVTQSTMEVLYRSQTQLFALGVVQSVVVEALKDGNPNGLIQEVALELVNNGNPNGIVNSAAIEVVNNNTRRGTVQQVAIEELNNSTTFAGCVQAVAIEMLVKPEYDPMVSGLVNNPHYHI